MNVREPFGFADIYVYVFLAVIDADNHPLIDWCTRADEWPAAFLHSRQGIGRGFPCFKRNKDTISHGGCWRSDGVVAQEPCGEYAISSGFGEDVSAESQKISGRNFI